MGMKDRDEIGEVSETDIEVEPFSDAPEIDPAEAVEEDESDAENALAVAGDVPGVVEVIDELTRAQYAHEHGGGRARGHQHRRREDALAAMQRDKREARAESEERGCEKRSHHSDNASRRREVHPQAVRGS